MKYTRLFFFLVFYYACRMFRVRKSLPEYVLGGLVITACLAWIAVFHFQNQSYLTVAFLDVGQGDAIFIEAPNGNQILIDGGPSKKVLSELSKVVPFYDRSIDALILTHPHQDHIGGLIEVFKRYDIDYAFGSGSPYPSAEYKEWKDLVSGGEARNITVSRGMKIKIGENLWLEFLLPKADKNCGDDDIHDCMVVSKLTYSNVCFMFTGDMERNLEFNILKDDIDCDVLKIGHHGSKTSTSDALLAAVSPAFTIIQSGKDNRYGHPHEIILNKLQATGVSILRNDQIGIIKFRSDGNRIWLEK